tara:strand:- start:608 stop:1147 length:540 start_codon:yes stop_codon:yes gene_type:complete
MVKEKDDAVMKDGISDPIRYTSEVREFLNLWKSVDRDAESFAAMTMFDQLEAMYKQTGYIDLRFLKYPKGYVHPIYSDYPTDPDHGLRLDAVTRIQLHIMKEMAGRYKSNPTDFGNHKDFIERLAGELGGIYLDQTNYRDNDYLHRSPEAFQMCDVLGQWTAGAFNELMEQRRWLWGAK